MKKYWKTNGISILVSLVVGGQILTADILSRPYAAFGGGGLLFVSIIIYWVVRLEYERG